MIPRLGGGYQIFVIFTFASSPLGKGSMFDLCIFFIHGLSHQQKLTTEIPVGKVFGAGSHQHNRKGAGAGAINGENKL